jgi:hypothetical protein
MLDNRSTFRLTENRRSDARLLGPKPNVERFSISGDDGVDPKDQPLGEHTCSDTWPLPPKDAHFANPENVERVRRRARKLVDGRPVEPYATLIPARNAYLRECIAVAVCAAANGVRRLKTPAAGTATNRQPRKRHKHGRR